MVGSYAIDVDGLGKQYRVGVPQPYKVLRESLSSALGAPIRAIVGRRGTATGGTGDQFWALRNVSFQVQSGEVLGIIGPNGAGKTTLLKILSRITEPTEGQARLRGRLASLLEVGTGFHPELTGRENIFLNGALLGMRRDEVRGKFDEIVAFSGVEKFIDTPVKRYSSGMYVRLAFAVAAHLEADVLIVDEVLAVGDLEFQQKCLGRMQDVANSGRTVLVVSHSMALISSLCNRVILLGSGELQFDGEVSQGVKRYMARSAGTPSRDLLNETNRHGPGRFARVAHLGLKNREGIRTDTFLMGEPLRAEFVVECYEPIRHPEIGLAITNDVGVTLHLVVSTWEGMLAALEPGNTTYNVTLPAIQLFPGRYFVTPWLKHQGSGVDDQVDNALAFEVLSADVTGHRPYFDRYRSGTEVFTPSVWKRD